MPKAKAKDGAVEELTASQVEAALPELGIDGLATLVARANREYWDEDNASLPDPLYDRIVEALRALAPAHPLLDALGPSAPRADALDPDVTEALPPSQRLGAAVAHRRPMLSLDKCYGDEELLSWSNKFEGEILVMPKMDGIACSLRYTADGELRVAATRGSGREGDDITVNVLLIDDVPNRLPADLIGETALEVRGEIYMRLSVFRERFAAEFSNPRNLTAGAVKNKDPDDSRKGALSFFAYDIEGLEFEDEREKLDLIEALGFPGELCRILGREEIVESYQDFARRRPDLDYEIDGVVYRASSVAEQARMGSTGHHPRWSLAYKFQGDSGTTKLNDVIWSVSRTGTITPVAMLEPISLSGAMIGRASLHNLGQFEALGPTEGCTVEVTRRGGVIPKVERVVEAGEGPLYRVPTSCPACGGPVEVRKKREGEFLFCVDPKNCVQAQLGELEHFAKIAKIEGFGPKVVAQAHERGVLKSPADYYRLTLEQLESFDRLGRKSAQNLLDEVDKRRELPLATFLRALGVDHLGAQFADLLVRNFRTLEAIRALQAEQLVEIKGIKDAIANTLVEGIGERSELIEDLLSVVSLVEASEEEWLALQEADATPVDGPLEAKSYLFTGKLEAFTRKDAQTMVSEHGGTNAKSVTKDLDVLVIGAGRGQKSSKQKKAESLNEGEGDIEILGEAEFLTRIGR